MTEPKPDQETTGSSHSNDTKSPSEASLSTRVSLRWIPDPPFENTDTIVMSLQGWYLDLRVDNETQKIDWAIAGQRIVESEEPRRVLFTHELDSHKEFATTDCGTFNTLPNGDDLETGSMPRSDIPGAPVTDYEEVWRELSFREGPEGPGKGLSWILESEGEKEILDDGTVAEDKIFLARIWGTFLVLKQRQFQPPAEAAGEKQGEDVSARREEWDATDGWSVKYVLGDDGASLPSLAKGFEGEETWKGRESVMIDGKRYTVRAFEEIF